MLLCCVYVHPRLPGYILQSSLLDARLCDGFSPRVWISAAGDAWQREARSHRGCARKRFHHVLSAILQVCVTRLNTGLNETTRMAPVLPEGSLPFPVPTPPCSPAQRCGRVNARLWGPSNPQQTVSMNQRDSVTTFSAIANVLSRSNSNFALCRNFSH